MYYPFIKRRDQYAKTAAGQFYSGYTKYFNEISEDCLHRCIYCDISVKENGGEGMQLDHFRPQHKFPELADSPFNLVLSCAKCNRLKSKHWPDEVEGEGFFLDHFTIERSKHFLVDNEGIIRSSCPPSTYMTELLALNRQSRSLIRKSRRLKNEASCLLEKIENELTNYVNADQVDKSRLAELAMAIGEIRTFLQAL